MAAKKTSNPASAQDAKKIVITGALGHIGSKLIRELPIAFPGVHIVMVDSMMTQRYTSLFGLPYDQKYGFIEGDILKLDLAPIVKNSDAVIHLAAITNATASFDNKEEVEHVNFNAAARVADACAKTGVPMIHLSSTSVYGDQSKVVDEECGALKPQSPYAETKLKEERYLEKLGKEKKLDYVTCRFGTICGTSPGMRFHTAVNIFCWQAAMGQPLTVWKTALHQKRPYLTLTDAAAAIKFIIRNRIFDRRVYNILSHNLTVNDIVTTIRKSIPGAAVKLVESKIMNQLSYEVSSKRFEDKGFRFSGSVEKEIHATLELIRYANNTPNA